jgi:thiol-disulfide isomerase/thioredoxin
LIHSSRSGIKPHQFVILSGAIMRWPSASLLVVTVFLLAGCRTGEKRLDDDRLLGPDKPSDLTGRSKERAIDPDSPAHWLDRPKPDWMRGNTPTAPSWNTPKDPGYDYKSETTGLLAGYVEDPDGRKLKNVYVAVREVGDNHPKDIGVLTLGDGAFTIQGLKPNRNYVLSVNMAEADRKLFGVVYTKTPNPNVRLALLEGEGGSQLPGTKPVNEAGPKAPAVPIGTDDPLKRLPTNNMPSPGSGPLPVPNMESSSRGRSGLPSPRPLESDMGVIPTGGYETPPARGQLPDRYDLTTDNGPIEWRPPSANIPTPRAGAPIPSPDFNRRSESRKSEKYTLVDARGQGVNLPQSKLVLLTFVTTGSETCRRVVPKLNAIQTKYAARGVEVVGMVCDDEPLNTRVMASEQFRRELDVSFMVATEPGKRAGDLLKRYGIPEIPTAVLLNANGDVLWQGHPAKDSDAIQAIENQLRSTR